MTGFIDTRLVQRLEKPLHRPNPFAFGGGLKNGGLSDEAFDRIAQVAAFDYMGAAEFEFGIIPKTLEKILNADLMTFEFKLNYVPIYVICPSAWYVHVKVRITELSKNKCQLKRGSGFPNALNPSEEWHRKTVGWLELDNGFMFFTDEEMFQGMATLFGASHAV